MKLTTRTRMLRILAMLLALIAILAFTTPSFASTLPANSSYTLHQQQVQLTFDPTHWSQQVWVNAGTWTFKYACDSAGIHDGYNGEAATNTPQGIEWPSFVPNQPAHLVCDNQWHLVPYTFHYGHLIVIGVSRAITGYIIRWI